MAGADKNAGNFISKKEPDDNPVVLCKGWIDACEFCDKRFNKWVPADDESLQKIPSKPGILAFALKSKSNTEVVSITVETTNLQNASYNESDRLRQIVSDKKSKVAKAAILVRWMTLKKPDDKDICTLFAHWINYGVLPKYMNKWPGERFLQDTSYFMYSAQSQKWCYPKKDPVWKKTKPAPTTTSVTEVVEKCNFLDSCSYCDDYFTSWREVDEVVKNNLAPEDLGIVLYSVKYRKKREVLMIQSDPKNIATNIKSTIKSDMHWIQRNASDDKFFDPASSQRGTAEVRWLNVSNPNDENSCFLYAHWLNADTRPMLNRTMPGEKVLERTKRFLLRIKDQKWCYEVISGKPNRFSKSKNKRAILDQIEDEYHT